MLKNYGLLMLENLVSDTSSERFYTAVTDGLFILAIILEKNMSTAEIRESSAEIMESSAAPPSIEFPGNVNIFTLEQITAWTSDFRNSIGQGGQATVYLGKINWPTSNLNGHSIAVKRSKMTSQVKDIAKNEVKVLSSVQHPNIVQVIGVCSTPIVLVLVIVLGWRNIVNAMTGAALGLQHLHNQQLIFRDFKTDNILLDKDFSGVLCDVPPQF
ncbi:probable serine/threonine-protein kinase PBL20 [Solanum pennellii]|uniref:Probable serine/threonine-protein kinase PBL20 n=1 Tax=Solanum pennellii TaxID=28526 RepID=A0ABM1V1Y0_SOLPN|nr:probable serine/threonine-protein kinase PBL20 [Solanum pennellii]